MQIPEIFTLNSCWWTPLFMYINRTRTPTLSAPVQPLLAHKVHEALRPDICSRVIEKLAVTQPKSTFNRIRYNLTGRKIQIAFTSGRNAGRVRSVRLGFTREWRSCFLAFWSPWMSRHFIPLFDHAPYYVIPNRRTVDFYVVKKLWHWKRFIYVH
jgi:hypothetical protein